MLRIDSSITDILIPSLIILAVFALVMVRIVVEYHRKRELAQLHHAERMAAIAKGIEVPPLPPEFFATRYRRMPLDYLRRGLIFTLIGIAAAFAGWKSHDELAAHGVIVAHWWALVLVAIGVGNLVYYAITRADQRTDRDR